MDGVAVCDTVCVAVRLVLRVLVELGVGVSAASRHRPEGECTSAPVPALKAKLWRGVVASQGATVTTALRTTGATTTRHQRWAAAIELPTYRPVGGEPYAYLKREGARPGACGGTKKTARLLHCRTSPERCCRCSPLAQRRILRVRR